jgi:hypothetical protein
LPDSVKELGMPQWRGFRDGKGNPHTKPERMGFELEGADQG